MSNYIFSRKTIKLLLSLSFLLGSFSCKTSRKDKSRSGINNSKNYELNLKLTWNKTIRQIFDVQEVSHFVENNNFNANKKPNIFFVLFDTLRRDYATKHATHHMGQFMNENITPNHTIAAGSATVYSLFTLFYSNPAFLAYKHYLTSLENEEKGSFPLKVLKKLGYKIHVLGQYISCNCHSEELGSWTSQKEVYFGPNCSLIDKCETDSPKYDYEEPYKDKYVFDHFQTELNAESNLNSGGHFFLVYYYGTHDKYTWDPDQTDNLPWPDDLNRSEKEHWCNENQYINAVRSTDTIFGKTVNELKAKGIFDNSVIVLLSDHGELHGKYKKRCHGGYPYREISENLTTMKFPGVDSSSFAINYMSLQDIFPTVFDYMGVRPESDFMVGKSILSEYNRSNLESSVVIQSAGSSPTRKMVLMNGRYKANIEVTEEDEPNFYTSKSFVLKSITSHNDKSLKLEGTDFAPCLSDDVKKCKQAFENNFKDALRTLYGELN